MNKAALLLAGLLLASPLSAEESQPVAAELQLLQDLQDGLALTLAACMNEPHCITALNENEMNQMQEALENLAPQLQTADTGNAMLLDHFEQLKARHQTLQQAFKEAITNIDRNSLEGNWADQFVFDDFTTGPTVPFPNEHILLSRFEDLNQPLPIE